MCNRISANSLLNNKANSSILDLIFFFNILQQVRQKSQSCDTDFEDDLTRTNFTPEYLVPKGWI